jgi:preprotein translocase subunit YajC
VDVDNMMMDKCIIVTGNKAKCVPIREVKKGDKVVTTGGIHGKIVELKDLTCVLDTGEGSKLKVNRAAINMEASALLNTAPSEK